MKRRNLLTMAIACLLTFVSVFSATACGDGLGTVIKGDSTKVVVNVWNYDGGVGHKWLDEIEKRFEAYKADTVYEGAGVNGADLKGVDVLVYNTKDDPLQTLSGLNQSVFFIQNVRYHEMSSQNKMLDISDIVTETLPNESKSIEDKMSSDLKAALSNRDGKYYALPHYQSFDGLTYNKTLFDEKNWYFAKNTADYASNDVNDPSYGFIANKDCEKTCGPDGEYGTYDDGLPSSVEELKRLCNNIVDSGKTPFIWYNANNYTYQYKLINSLWANLEGYEGAMANFNFNTGDVKTDIVTGFNGSTPTTKSVAINDENAFEVYQQESRYYALDFANFVFTNDAMYHEDSITSTASQIEIQRTFLKDEVAMLLEGTYWENEARDAGTFDSDPALKDVETAFMPLPIKGTGTVAEGEGRAPVIIDTLDSYAFINANTQAKHGEVVLDVAKEFLQFCYTDQSLAEFTEKSTVTKNLEYGTNPNLSNATNFVNSVWEMKKISKSVAPISAHNKFMNNPSEFNMTITAIWKAGDYQSPYAAFVDGKISAKEHFLNMAKDKAWWDRLAG